MAVLSTMALFWPASAWPVTFLACSGGFSNILYAFGMGYGLSMTATAGLTAAIVKYHHRTPMTPFGLACCGLYAAYGIRLTSFLVRRHEEDSYKNKFDTLQLKSDLMDFGSKFALVAGVSFSQAIYALPLAVANSPAVSRAPPRLRAVGWAGVGIAAFGLLVEHFADEQKLAGKREAPNAPVMDGMYSYCRHPNYFGELLFHGGVSCMAATGTPLQVVASVVPTFFMAFTMLNSARRSDREGDHRYAKIPGYSAWAANTPVLIPCVPKAEAAVSASVA